MTNRKIEYWVIPPEADAEFVAGMEEVLETYALAYTRLEALRGRQEHRVVEQYNLEIMPKELGR